VGALPKKQEDKSMKTKVLTFAVAIALAGGAYPAVAQDAGTGDAYANTASQEEDNDFPWGLLGLLGLAGLMGRKRDNNDDSRRTSTGTNNRT
jgi:hypothetical protein